MFRQGDVLIVPVNEIPKSAEPQNRDNGRHVLAYGEVTGHAHAIHEPRARMFMDTGGGTYLDLPKPAKVVHEEHATIGLDAGKYRVIRQREYTAGEARMVAD